MTATRSFHASHLIASSRIPEGFAQNPIVATLRAQRRNAARVTGPALLLTALALMPAGPAQAAPLMFTKSNISTAADSANSVFSADLDGDGDVDVLSASVLDDKIAWYENDGAPVPGFTPHTVSTTADAASSVYAADLDGDGDVDVLSASYLDDKIAWYENDGLAHFTPRTISPTANGAVSVFATDLDGDGDVDVLSASFVDDKIAWYENNGAPTPSFTQRTISTTADNASSVFAADLDGDGDMDVLSASQLDDKVAWYENDGAVVPGFILHTISTTAVRARSVYAADLDGDGDVDVLSASETDDKVVWYENNGMPAPGFTPRTISITAADALSVYATDLDADGDVDVLSASGGDNKIAWYENDGMLDPGFTLRTISTSASVARSVFAADLDGDGDLDVLSASALDDTIAAYYSQPADTTPDAFGFTDVTNVERNSVQTSNSVTVTGINTAAPISVSGGTYSIGCNGSFTAAAGVITNGQMVCVRHTASANFTTAVDTTLNVGGITDTYTSTTRAADTTADQFVFIDQSNTPRNSVRTSNTVTITGIEVPVPISVTGGLYSIGCTGVFTAAASVISSGQTVCVRNTTAPTFNTAVNTKLTVGGTADTFTTVTAPNALAALLGVVFGVLNGLLQGLFG